MTVPIFLLYFKRKIKKIKCQSFALFINSYEKNRNYKATKRKNDKDRSNGIS